MTENPRPASFGRVDADGTVYVVTADGERMVGQVPDSSPAEALAFFERRFEALAVEADLLSQRVKSGALSPEEARKAVGNLRTAISSANAVGDLAGLTARLDKVTDIIDAASAKRREEKARLVEESRVRKLAMVGQAEKLALSDDWRGGVGKFRELLEEWRALPRLDRASDDDLWRRFSTARTAYTRRRKAHFADLGEAQEQARAAKEAIVKEAAELADSTDWGATATAFRTLMERWKAAGSASRGADDELWAKFRSCQDSFFGRRSEVFNAQDKEFQANLEAKTALLDEAERSILSGAGGAAARTAYRDFLAAFNAIGKIPREAVKAVEARLQALDAAISEADRREWARTDPQTRATAEGTVNLFSGKLDRLHDDLAKAKASGNANKEAQIQASIASVQALLDQATQTLQDISR
ncbi:MAG: DUF349 domain-containing protein [Propionibacteriaceae bacterium]|jgi:hypothetical protein|nr:DUF349 domain-containing protein [Propionibacteriaceae bacterium]